MLPGVTCSFDALGVDVDGGGVGAADLDEEDVDDPVEDGGRGGGGGSLFSCILWSSEMRREEALLGSPGVSLSDSSSSELSNLSFTLLMTKKITITGDGQDVYRTSMKKNRCNSRTNGQVQLKIGTVRYLLRLDERLGCYFV